MLTHRGGLPPLTALPLLLLLLLNSCHSAHAAVELPEERVTGESIAQDQERSPGAVSVIRPQELRGEQRDLADLLERTPGLHVIRARGRGGYTVASIRGSTSGQVAVYIDGVRANLGSEAAVDLSTIPIENVERIEIYRGYIPARFAGSGMGGVIHVVTRTAKRAQSELSLGAASYGSWRGSVSHGTPLGKGRFAAAFHFDSSDGDFPYTNDNGTPYTPADDYRTKRQHNRTDNSELQLKWGDGRWQSSLSWRKNERELPFPAPGSDKPNTPDGANWDSEQWEFSIGRSEQLGNVALQWHADYLSQKKDFFDPHDGVGGFGEQRNQYRTERTGALVSATLAAGERHWIEAFAEYRHEALDVTGDIVNTLQGNRRFSQDSWNIALQDTVDLNGKGTLLLTPSVRWNQDREDNDSTWQVGLSYALGQNWLSKASYGTYSRGPNFYERYGDGASIRPNRDLQWETGTQWDVGVHHSHTGKRLQSRIGLTYFNRDSENLIEYIQANPRYGIYQNIGKASVKGVELEMHASWEQWAFFACGTWMESRNNTPDSYAYGNPLPHRPEWEGVARLTRFIPKGSLFIETQYMGENAFDDRNSMRMSSLTLWNVGGTYKLNPQQRLAFGVNDLFDKNKEMRLLPTGNGPTRMLWYPMQGRSYYGTFFWDF